MLPDDLPSAFGEAWILRVEQPRPVSDILADLGEVSIPNYALNLIGSFNDVANCNLELTPPRTEISQRPRQIRQQRDVKTRSLQVQDVTPRTSKRWSIFSLNLPHRHVLDPPPLSTVAEGVHTASPRGARLKRVQRSTRNRDLALLSAAPDDIQAVQVPPAIFDTSTSNQPGTSGGSSVITRVKRRFAPLRVHS